MLHQNWINWACTVHRTLYDELSITREEMQKKSPEELADVGFVCKKIYEQLDDIRKEVENLQGLAEKLACLKAATNGQTKIQGELATATPDVSMSANLPHPKKNPEAYSSLCAFLGISEQAVKYDLIRIHWPGFKDFFSARMAQGLPVPPGIEIDKTHTHFKLKYRGRTHA